MLFMKYYATPTIAHRLNACLLRLGTLCRTNRQRCINNQRGLATQGVDDALVEVPTGIREGGGDKKISFKEKIKIGPALGHFLNNTSKEESTVPLPPLPSSALSLSHHPYVTPESVSGIGRKVYFFVYGCQMNVNDTEIVWSILQKSGFERTTDRGEADVILVMTCSIRDGAEEKIWKLMGHLKGLKKKRQQNSTSGQVKIGILGCMAERLKHKILEKAQMVDLIAGPDSYKDLPRMLAVTGSGQTAVNVLLSLDETYADIMPVRLNENSKSAYISIMRGCDNMCSYCIVPFTRGRERSRPLTSILDEVRYLSEKGFKEIILLGQNVNSYRDLSSDNVQKEPTHMSQGFSTIYKTKLGGQRFSDLLQNVAEVNPEIRIRFTSPHPKDFPDEVLYLIRDFPNICKQIHLPAQSGNNRVLQSMRRGYTRESYLELVAHIRSTIPGIALSSDFICGFCGETDDEFLDTLSLMREVKFNTAFMFPYSMREKTHAYYKMKDDLPRVSKIARLNQMVSVYREEADKLNRQQIGSHQVVLVEGTSKRSSAYLAGRNDQNIKVIFPDCEIACEHGENRPRGISPGDFITVQINDANSQVLKGIPLYHTTLHDSNASESDCAMQKYGVT